MKGLKQIDDLFCSQEHLTWKLIESVRLLEEMYDTVSRLSDTTSESVEYVAD